MNASRELYINEEVSIPHWELSFSFNPSSGPGGQHANRSATRVTVHYDIVNSPSLTEAQRRRVLKRLSSRIDQHGILSLSAQESRSQHQNRQLVLERLQELLVQALKRKKRRRKTRPSAAANERRLRQKKRRGQRKQERRRDWFRYE